MTLAKMTCTFQPALLSSTAFGKITQSVMPNAAMTLAIGTFSIMTLAKMTCTFQPSLLSTTAFAKMAHITKTHAK
jgi:hypothetical protein